MPAQLTEKQIAVVKALISVHWYTTDIGSGFSECAQLHDYDHKDNQFHMRDVYDILGIPIPLDIERLMIRLDSENEPEPDKFIITITK